MKVVLAVVVVVVVVCSVSELRLGFRLTELIG